MMKRLYYIPNLLSRRKPAFLKNFNVIHTLSPMLPPLILANALFPQTTMVELLNLYPKQKYS